MEKDKVFVAVSKDETIVDFIRVYIFLCRYWLERIYTISEYRGQGMGKRLLEEAENYIRRTIHLYIMVLPQHTTAL